MKYQGFFLMLLFMPIIYVHISTFLNITMCDYPQWHIPQSQCYKDLIYYFISTF